MNSTNCTKKLISSVITTEMGTHSRGKYTLPNRSLFRMKVLEVLVRQLAKKFQHTLPPM